MASKLYKILYKSRIDSVPTSQRMVLLRCEASFSTVYEGKYLFMVRIIRGS